MIRFWAGDMMQQVLVSENNQLQWFQLLTMTVGTS